MCMLMRVKDIVHRKGDSMQCITEGCDNKQRTRGLCNACYYMARVLIRDGKTTWEEMVRRGVAKPSETHWRRKALLGEGA